MVAASDLPDENNQTISLMEQMTEEAEALLEPSMETLAEEISQGQLTSSQRRQLHVAVRRCLDQALAERSALEGDERGALRWAEVMERVILAYVEGATELAKKMAADDDVPAGFRKMFLARQTKTVENVLQGDGQAQLVFGHLWSRAMARAMSNYWLQMDKSSMARQLTEMLESLEQGPDKRFWGLDYFTELAKLLPDGNSGTDAPAKAIRKVRDFHLNEITYATAPNSNNVMMACSQAIAVVRQWGTEAPSTK